MSTSTPNTTEARHQAAAAPSRAGREAEVAGTVPYRRQRGTLSEPETAREGMTKCLDSSSAAIV